MTGRTGAAGVGLPGDQQTGDPTVRPVGDSAFLVEVSGTREVHDLAKAVRERFADRMQDIVPGESTLLLCWAGPPPTLAELTAELRTLSRDPPGEPGPLPATRTIIIPVCYEGADLEAVASRVGLDADRLVELHTEPEYLVAFIGFAPGFAYLTGGSPQLRLPRRKEPRAWVPAGSVALASAYSAVYPRAGPGGWHLLGRTDAVLFDPERDPPALLEAGMHVVFEAR